MLYLDYNEKQIHGTREFPIAFYHVDAAHPRYEMPFHWHKEYEIVRILEGTFHLVLSGIEIPAHPGESILIPSGALHGGTPNDCIYECLVFDLDVLFLHSDVCRQYLKKIKHQEITVRPLITRESKSLCLAIDMAFDAMARHFMATHEMESNAADGSQPGYELIATGSLLNLFGLIFSEGHYTESSPEWELPFRHANQLKAVFEYIETHYSSEITLKQLSQISGMSPKYFCRYFQTFAHRTPMDYINYYRIERACSQLCTTDSPVTSIAYDCGFNDCSYFIKQFKRYKHITPKQYQLQMKP